MTRRVDDPFRRYGKPAVFAFGLLPLGLLAYDALTGQLTADPIAFVTHETGAWTLRFLVLTLAVTPLQRITGRSWFSRFRRMIGLIAFFYALLHLTTYLWLDKYFAWDEIIPDLTKRRFIIVGAASLLLMVPLAATSFNAAQRWLGGKRWKRLHRLTYLIPLGGVVHYLWLVKADTRPPLTYGAVVVVLLALRLWWWAEKAWAARPRPPV
jgi:sulfoxide reductase heme-binding subunit YedZ